MRFIDDIFSLVWDIAQWFYLLYQDSKDIPIVGWLISPVFYAIHRAFWLMTTPIAQWYNWTYNVNEKLGEAFSWDTVKSLILSWLPDLEKVIAWWSDWWQQILWSIEEWWLGVQTAVKEWIAAATEGLNSLIVAWDNFWTITWPELTGELANLRGEWNNFWSITYPTLVSFSWLGTWFAGKLLEIQGLINSAFTVRESFWAGWQDWRDKVTEFFTDPEEWLYKAADRIIERFW